MKINFNEKAFHWLTFWVPRGGEPKIDFESLIFI